MRKSKIALAALLLLGGAAIATAAYNQVPISPTASDAAAARKLLGPIRPLPADASFDEQVRAIRMVQDKVLDAAPLDRGIPLGQTRNLADVIKAGHGLCYDRSRAIEDALRVLGLKVRHVSVYSTAEKPPVQALLTPGIESHALSEVLTRRGWMLVGSNTRWISLRRDGRPLSIAQLRTVAPADRTDIDGTPAPPIFQNPEFTWLYGLYSRHGDFYPPYNVVPDVNWSEFADNV